MGRHATPRQVRTLAGIFGVSGVLHFVITDQFAAIVPEPLPAKRELVQISGVLELACAGLLSQPRTRRLGGLLSAGLLVAVLPANLQMTWSAMQNPKTPTWYRIGTIVRLPMQIPPLRWALRAARG